MFIIEFPRFISGVSQHISKNRANVLYKAIVGIKNSSPEDLAKVSHEMSGAVGFYELENEMNLINGLQKWIELNPDVSNEEIDFKRNEVVAMLEETFSNLNDATEVKK